MPARALAVGVVLVVTAVGCGENGRSVGDTGVDGLVAAPGITVTIVATGFVGPTQFTVLPDGDLIVAELNGGEPDGTGRVVRVDATDVDDRTVIADGLVAPTGVAVDGDRLWIMEQRRLTTGSLDGRDGRDGRRTVLDDLPFNGRSEGTITNVPGGGVFYNTSGSRDQDRPDVLKPGSGTLWFLASPEDEPVPFATGFKHAYAHVVDGDGVVWSTEMSDGRLDGAVPPDELVRVAEGDDFGYPRCVGDRTPVVELGATPTACADTPASHALFEPGATPTSVAIAPWDDDLIVVALWNRGEVVTTPRSIADRPYEPSVILSGLESPQHLVTDGDRLLVSEFATGRLLAISAA